MQQATPIPSGDSVERLARDILHCDIVERTLAGEATPCQAVVEWQGRQRRPRYCPEPWVGHIDRAPILFISSNPSADRRGEQPVYERSLSNEDDIEVLVQGASCAFDPGQAPGMTSGVYLVDRQGARYGHAVRYWSWAKRMARELLHGREPVPGMDYCLTEVVHCGSQAESGIAAARDLCAHRYLDRLLRVSAAHVLVIVGIHARTSFAAELGIAIRVGEMHGPADIAGRQRCVISLPHPNARGKRWGLRASLGDDVTNLLLNFTSSVPSGSPRS